MIRIAQILVNSPVLWPEFQIAATVKVGVGRVIKLFYTLNHKCTRQGVGGGSPHFWKDFLKSTPLGQNFALRLAKILVNNWLCVRQPPRFFLRVRLCIEQRNNSDTAYLLLSIVHSACVTSI